MNPASNLKLASGIAPVKRFIDEGIALAIGTDGAGSNNALDMFREMYLVSVLAKYRETTPRRSMQRRCLRLPAWAVRAQWA